MCHIMHVSLQSILYADAWLKPNRIWNTVRLGSTEYLTFRPVMRTQKIAKSKIHPCYGIKRANAYTVAFLVFAKNLYRSRDTGLKVKKYGFWPFWAIFGVH